MNDTQCSVQVPGFTHNGDCNLLCKPTDWKDIAVFFLGNYGAHVATVIGRPGQSSQVWVFTLVLALCFPGTGVLAGLTAIISRAIFAPTELTRAARAGALCIVVKNDAGLDGAEDRDLEASRQSSESVRDASANADEDVQITPEGSTNEPITESSNLAEQESRDSSESIEQTVSTRPVSTIGENATLDGRPDEILPSSFTATQVHGITRLPAGYRLLVLPTWTSFEADSEDPGATSSPLSPGRRFKAKLAAPFRSKTTTVPCSYNLVKVLISIGQLFFSVVTLYQTRGNQVEVFGYAAFGLTVAPYFWMSFVNLLGNLMCPQYPMMFVVNSPALDDLKTEIANKGLTHRYQFDGTVGRISKDMQDRVLETNGYLLKCKTALQVFFTRLDPEQSRESWVLVYQAIAALAIAAVPVAIVGGISRFDTGRSVASQRVWTMMWLCLGPLIAVGYGMWIMPFFESRPVLWRAMVLRPDEYEEETQVTVLSKEATNNESREQVGH